MDPQDETAAERRRTQIRLAQRAYRQRKETTISALKVQVSQLQETITEMKDSFLHFSDSAMNIGVAPEVANELKRVTQQFILHAKAQGDEDDQQDDYLVDNDEIISSLATQPAASKKARSGSRASSLEYTENIGLGYKSVFDLSSIPVNTVPVLDKSHFHEDSSPKSSNDGVANGEPNTDDQPSRTTSNQSLSPVPGPIQTKDIRPHPDAYNVPFTMRSYHTRIPDEVVPVAAVNDFDKSTNSADKPFIYSFQETTFARRLQRASVECGYHLIAQAHIRPKVFKRVFKLSLLYGSREQIAARFKAILTRSTQEPIEFWQTPMIRLGGAGTHYPRLNDDGSPYVPPNSYNVEHVVPGSNLIQLRNVENGEVYCDMMIDISGYEGEWFDPTDVEGYLASKGIYIDPQSSFADCQVLESELPELAHTPQSSEKTPLSSNPATPLLPNSHQPNHANTEYSYLSSSFFNDLDRTHMTSIPANTQDPFTLNFDPTTLTSEAFESFSKPVQYASRPNATANNPVSLMSSNALVDRAIDTFVDNLSNTMDVSNNTSSASSAFDTPVDFDNLPLDEQNTWGFSGMDLDAFSASAVAAVEGLDAGMRTNTIGFAGGAGDRQHGQAAMGRRQVTVDVTRLIEELLKGGVCLGRAPGFRKKDVDRALEVAMMPAF